MSISSEYFGGLDASREIERQISLTINNLAHELSSILMSHDVAKQLQGEEHVKFFDFDQSFWKIKFEKDTLRIESISFWYSYEKGREPLEYLTWTRETKGQPKVKNYLWMRRGHRPKVLMICHSALELLLSGLVARFPEMKEYVDHLAQIRKYALALGK
ncbi:MAG: hypothetical protein ACAH17_03590 [Candidatus Paceibacterota bacterium]